MKYFLVIICFLSLQFGYACGCETKAEIDMMDINDSDIILTATLSKIEALEQAKKLTFLVSKIHKGEKSVESVSHILKEDLHHHSGAPHHVDTVFIGQEWILFSASEIINDEVVYRVNESNSSNYCMLSRPLVEDDPYLSYIKEIMKEPNCSKKTYYKNKSVSAIGSLNNKFPEGDWKYYTRNDLDHYWEGTYTNTRRDGLWQERAMNFNNEKVVINEEDYENGILKERIAYNFLNEKQLHETFDDKINKRVTYRKNIIYSIVTYYKVSNKSTIEYFKNGKSTNWTVQKGQIF